MRGVGFFIPWARNMLSQSPRGTISALTMRLSALLKAAAIALGEMRA